LAETVSITAEIETFVVNHRAHGHLTGDATEPRLNGYQVTITCPCGVVFIRWVSPSEATIDLTALGRLN
jgi:hypothetical protein